ncbi:MAG: hypothetical protein HRF40_07915 [Nitrososphaera sp.]|jgi:hypothetical protein
MVEIGRIADRNGLAAIEFALAHHRNFWERQEMTWKVQQQIEWRRSKVLEYSSQGFNQKEIAAKLQVDESTVSRDFAFLREQAGYNIRHYVEDKLPLEFEKCLAALTAVRRNAWVIAEQAANDKLKLQALALVKDCASTTMDMLTNCSVVDDAVRFVEEGGRRLSEQSSAADKQATTVRAKADERALKSGTKAQIDLPGLEKKAASVSAGRTATTANKVF